MAKAKKIEPNLTDVLADTLNKADKTQQVAFSLDASDAPVNVDHWVSFGSAMLDIAVSNRAYGGAPVGRIVEITGLEQSGKSLVSAHLLAETQKQGGLAVLIDTEMAVSAEFLRAIGVDTSKLLYVAADSVEQCFEVTEAIIQKVREADRDKLVTIVVDSVAGASTNVELAADYDQAGYATQKAIIISKAMRKITNMIGRQKVLIVYTNQLRAKMNAMFGDPWTTSGGKAIAFHSSVRLRLKNMGQIKVGDNVVGIKVRVQVVKNRIGPPLRAVDMEIYFDRGIDNYGSWLKVMKENKLVTGAGAWYTYTDNADGEIIKFQSKDFIRTIKGKAGLEDQIYNRICEASIRKYVTDTDSLDMIDDDDKKIDTAGAGVGD
jgi:recombination protein RecA